jgi:hypothetical protein
MLYCPHMRELVGASDLIVGSWENLRKHIHAYLGYVVWFMALALVQWILLITTRNLIDDSIVRTVVYTLTSLPVALVTMVVSIGVLHMTSETLQKRKPDPRASFAHGIHRLVPFIWVSFLVGVILFFGALLLVFPFIYFFVTLAFAPTFLVVDGLRGTDALRASRDLVTGRWWTTMWRLAVPLLFFHVAAAFILAVLYLVFGSFFGDLSLFFQDVTSIHDLTNAQLLVSTVLPQVVQGFMLPLYVAAELLLWFDLKRG